MRGWRVSDEIEIEENGWEKVQGESWRRWNVWRDDKLIAIVAFHPSIRVVDALVKVQQWNEQEGD